LGSWGSGRRANKSESRGSICSPDLPYTTRTQLACSTLHGNIVPIAERKYKAKAQSDQIAAAAVKAYDELKAQKPFIILDKCPFCQQPTGKPLRREPVKDKIFADMGAKIIYYKCTNPDCGEEYDKPENFQHPGSIGGDPLIEP
jgi:hypothetical protein